MRPLSDRHFEFRDPSHARPTDPVVRGFPRVAVRAVEEPSDADPNLRRITVLALILGSCACWAAIGAAVLRVLF